MSALRGGQRVIQRQTATHSGWRFITRSHDMRHVAAIGTPARGTNLAAFSVQLRHSNVVTTGRIHVTQGRQTRAAALMPGLGVVSK